MHLHNRKSVLGIALSSLLVLAICPAAFAFPLQQPSFSDGPEQAYADEPAQLELITTCREQIDETAAEIAAAEAEAIEAREAPSPFAAPRLAWACRIGPAAQAPAVSTARVW